MRTRTGINTLLIMSVFLLAIAPMAFAETITVDDDGPADYNNIQAAINAAVNGDTVLVADGTYTGDGNRDIDFGGSAITVRSIDPNDPNIVATTIIDCNATEADQHRGFYFYNGEDANSVLDGFTITRGCADRGGGIYCEFSNPTISNCTVSDNIAFSSSGTYQSGGGGIYCFYSNPMISNCIISGNSASGLTGYGGGIYNNYSNPTLTNCTFMNNSVFSINQCEGGAIYNRISNPILSECTVESNTSKKDGGGVLNDSGSPTLVNCSFIGNSAQQGGGISNHGSYTTLINCFFNGNLANSGGAISNEYGSRPTLIDCMLCNNSAVLGGGMFNTGNLTSPHIINCTFESNSADSSGGGACNYYGSSPNLVNCSFINNSAFGEQYDGGGAIYNDDPYSNGSPPILTDCTLISNSAVNGRGGGVYNSWRTCPILTNCLFSSNIAKYGGGGAYIKYNYHNGPIFINCTFSGNISEYDSGGLAASPFTFTDPILTNCIFWGNFGEYGTDESGQISCERSIINYSCIQGWTGALGGTGNINSDPLFLNPSNDDLHLLPDSPCIDAGDPCYVAEPNETDLAGNPRVIDGRIDMGAYEANYIEVPMKFTPQALNLSSGGKLVKAHFTLPEDFDVNDVDVNTPAVISPFGAESYKIKVMLDDEGLVKVEATFRRSDLCSAATGNEPVEVTVIGKLTIGRYFYGTDIIKVTDRAFEVLGLLVSHWLESECGRPDWCGGADLNQDSVVNFLDFALLDGCCFEVVRK